MSTILILHNITLIFLFCIIIYLFNFHFMLCKHNNLSKANIVIILNYMKFDYFLPIIFLQITLTQYLKIFISLL